MTQIGDYAALELLESRLLLSASTEFSLPVEISDAAVSTVICLESTVEQTQAGQSPVVSHLANIVDQIETMKAVDPNEDVSDDFGLNHVRADGAIEVVVGVEEFSESQIAALKAAGLNVTYTSEDYKTVEGWISYESIDALAVVTGVWEISPVMDMPWVTNAGSEMTEGDAAMESDDLRTAMGVDGTGVKIGVISDGITHWTDAEAEGDLPSTITNSGLGAGDEGTAMLEIVHDIAPGSDLYFASASNASEMTSSIDWLVNQGVDVIVDDLTFYINPTAAYAQPYFTDGASTTVASKAKAATQAGVAYISCAGNWQDTFDGYPHALVRSHWQGQFTDTNTNSYHDFATGTVDEGNTFYVANGGAVYAEIQWSDAWGASSNNYDFYLYNSGLTAYYTSSTSVQDGDDLPREFISWTNTTGTGQYVNFVVRKTSGSSRELEMFTAIFGGSAPQYTSGDSLASQQAISEVTTTAAIDANDAGLDDVETFSSNGPSTIYTNFSTQTKTTRNSLDVAAFDGVSTYIGTTAYFGDPFYGTSAAAPHLAGLAGLMLELNPSLTPAQVESIINGNAVDIGTAGYDSVSGYGRVDAMAMLTDAATSLDLKAGSDTGSNSTDNLTKLDNSAAGKELQFDVLGTVSGATVRIYAGEEVIGTGTGNGGTMTITTDGDYDLTDGQQVITVTQQASGQLESAGEDLTITIDMAGPTLNSWTITSNEGSSGDLKGTSDLTPQLVLTFNENVYNDGQQTSVEGFQDDATTADANPNSTSWNNTTMTASYTSDLARDDYRLDVVGVDEAGNASSTQSINWLVLHKGDGNFDDHVDDADYTIWADNYNLTGSATWQDGDWNGDGDVDDADYTLWADNYGDGNGVNSQQQMMMSLLTSPVTFTYSSVDLGNGLTGYTFTVNDSGTTDASWAMDLCFTGLNGASVNQVLVGGSGTVHTEEYAQMFDGWYGYEMELDTWVYDGFSWLASPVEGTNPDSYEFHIGTGADSEYGDMDVLYIVSDGVLEWDGVIGRLGVRYEVSGTTSS